MLLIGRPMLSTIDVELVGRNDLADRLLRRRRTDRPFPRRACRSARARASGSGRRRRPGRSCGRGTAPARTKRTTKPQEADHERARDARARARAGRGSRRGSARSARSKPRWKRDQRIARRRLAPCARRARACGCSRYFAIVGTSVRDRMNEQIIANITASAIGTNRKRATPSRKNIGTNTMQMQSSETKAGVTICAAPSRIAVLDVLALLEMPVDVLDRHRRVVDQDADRERQAAERHDVERLAERRRAARSRRAPTAGSRSR